MLTEEELVTRILNGNLHAFQLLVKQHTKLVNSMVSRMVQNEEDVQDICQDVFIKVYKHLDSFKFNSKLSTWIGRIAYSTSINHLKKVSGKATMTLDIAGFENMFQTNEDPETILTQKNTSAYIQMQINKLPVQYRVVLTLYHLNELSYLEIEEITGMPEGTVKSYLFRARKLLKDKLENYFKQQR
ncbi:RNA polymerase subunit sigma-24 [Mucilaginibacter sp. MD40]|uniref:RNA polymerase sigma factor n=1 Tax=Mucilaginibacter sp. MD40 TaxID=2029590 RepID=UPI000BACDB6E|nr:sigma-70 family RNA polymerase sigma factor [Mucilaginibacter sp. MD40]PAW94691.1 RNA polymerase subunit sigma-24 [Mucilaginibacter sp. MD40]